MTLGFYMDVHIPRAITNRLKLKGIDVLTAQDDGAILFSDDKLLDRATSLERPLVTFDDDLLSIASNHLKTNKEFSGIIYAHPLKITIGECIQNLELISNVVTINEIKNQIIFLPI